MSELIPSTLETHDYGSDLWNAVYSTNFEKLNDGVGYFLNDLTGKVADIQIKEDDDSNAIAFEIVNSSDIAIFTIKYDGTIELGGSLNAQENDLDNVGDLIHDDAIASDWTLKNEDSDKDIIFSGNDGGVQTDIMKLDVSAGQLSGMLKAVSGVLTPAVAGTDYQAAGSYLSNVVEDTTPQLGGSLDAQEYEIDNVGDLIHDDATASDWTLKNEDSDKDIIFSGNDGGVQTEILKLDASEGQLSGMLKAVAGVLTPAVADTDYLTTATAGTTYAKLDGSNDPFTAEIEFQNSIYIGTAVADAYTKSLLHFDGADGSTVVIDDVGGHTWTVSGGAYQEIDYKKFGTASMWYPLAGKVAAESTDFVIGQNQFTLDFWIFRSDYNWTSYYNLFEIGTGGTNTGYLTHSTGQITCFGITSSAISYATWYHVAIVGDGTNIKFYLSGILQGTVEAGYNLTSGILTIGNNNAGAWPWQGFIDEVRLSVGVQRWTTNFTPPVVSYISYGEGIITLHDGATANTATISYTKWADLEVVNGLVKCNGSGNYSAAVSGTDYLFNIVEDTTPQLGGSLDAQEYEIDNVGDLIHDDATASDWTLKNEDSDKDIIFSGNDGGVQTEILKLDASEGQLSGMLKAVAGVLTPAVAGTDYQAASQSGEYDNGNSGATKTIGWENGAFQKITMTDNCVFSFSNPTKPGWYFLRSIQDADGTNTYTWTGGGLAINWGTGEPSWNATGTKVNIHEFYFDGNNWYGRGFVGA